MPRPCRSESEFSRPRHSAAWAWHVGTSRDGICATFPLSASSGYDTEFHEGCYQKHTSPLNCRTSISDVSSYHADVHEGHGTVREWQGRGMACVNYRGTAWARHAICELALTNNSDMICNKYFCQWRTVSPASNLQPARAAARDRMFATLSGLSPLSKICICQCVVTRDALIMCSVNCHSRVWFWRADILPACV
jgi:hypothetical protein